MSKYEKRHLVFYKDHPAIIEDVIELDGFPFVVIYKIQSSIFGQIEVFEEDLQLPSFED